MGTQPAWCSSELKPFQWLPWRHFCMGEGNCWAFGGALNAAVGFSLQGSQVLAPCPPWKAARCMHRDHPSLQSPAQAPLMLTF